jgi:signal transduction histidine kinase
LGLSVMHHARKGASHGTEGRMDGVRVANGGAARVFRPTDPQLRSMSGLASAEVAHAIKHPLIALRRRLEDSHKKPLGRGQLQEIIYTCISELDLMVAMFDAVLDMAYIESGCLKSRFTTVNLQSVLSKLVDVYEPVVQDAGQSLVVSCDSVKEAWLKGDQYLLFLIFNNLIENAIRYSPAETTISINLTRKPGSLVVSIGDNGSGLSAEDRERVFRPFFRVEPTRNTHGHGLGIPLAAAIVRLHGGSIVLRDNAPGLRAVVHLPKLEIVSARQRSARTRHDCHPSAHPVDRPK